jgi:hypothetical protein
MSRYVENKLCFVEFLLQEFDRIEFVFLLFPIYPDKTINAVYESNFI